MDTRKALVAVSLVVALSSPARAFLDDLLIPLNQLNTYRRAAYEPTYGNANTGYANSRPVLYQLFPWMNPQQQSGVSTTTYETTASNPLVSFLQSAPWFAWIGNNRQPVVQSSTTSPTQQTVWSPVGLLPWNGGNTQGPMVSFFQNPVGSLFPWNRPVSTLATVPAGGGGGGGASTAVTGVAYQTPVMPTAAVSTLQVIRPVSSSADPSSPSSSVTSSIPVSSMSAMMEPQRITGTEDGSTMAAMLMEDAVVQQLPTNNIRGPAGAQPCQ